MFFKIGDLRDFATFTRKYLCWSLFLTKFQPLRTSTLFKRDFNTGVSLWIFQNFYEQLFFYNAFSGCFCQFDKVIVLICNRHCLSSLLNQKHNARWFLLQRFVDLVREAYLRNISRNLSNALLLINMQKTKPCPK